MRRTFSAYFILLIVFGGGSALVVWMGAHGLQTQEATAVIATPATTSASLSGLNTQIATLWKSNLLQPLSILIGQILIIVVSARMLGGLFGRMGQPAVIGEIIAGIVLGPSVLGAFSPEASATLFPASSLGTLKLLSNIGVLLFMFVIGMELDVRHLRQKASTAVMVSHVSIVFPYFLGVLAAAFLYHGYASPTVKFQSFALFMGIAMSITAFPVLARIIQERGLTGTYLGSTAITCAAVDDVTAWSLLAIVVAIVSSQGVAASALTILFSVVFVIVMLKVVKPGLARLISTDDRAAPSNTAIALVLLCIFASALFTEMIGIHALFGAFLAGVVMPNQAAFRRQLHHGLYSVTSVFLLPLFFAFTGLRTQVGLLNEPGAWAVCIGIIFLATLGKLGGSAIAARVTGMSWDDSFRLGALMNTRGLVELIVLNIGFEAGILTPLMFTIMVLMALTTTMMTGPLLSLADRIFVPKPTLAVSAPGTQ